MQGIHPPADIKWERLEIGLLSGHVRGGSGGLADPPWILEPIEKKLEIEHPDPLDKKPDIMISLCKISNS